MGLYAPPTRITLISHPATREQKTGIFPCDEPLEESALTELAATTWRPPGNSRHLSAPEQRARQTAVALGLDAAETRELRDCDFGRWSGRSLETLEMEDISAWLSDINDASHGGESFRDLMARVSGWLESQKDSGPVVAVTHASVVRAAIVHALGISPHEAFLRIEVAPLTMTDLRLTGGAWRVRSVAVPLQQAEPA